ncbi:MAG TPA: hypothetical protein VFB45_24170 [Pseudolabrys sp.]|nr:hypothetical protein [Pseudolabrys sp.]
MRAHGLGLLFLFAALAVQAAASPLDDLLPRAAGKTACFSRVYDQAHLRAHPKQTTSAMTVWLRYDQPDPKIAAGLQINLALTRRGEAEPLFAQGGCAWVEGGNRDVQGRPVVKSFKKNAGADCLMTARPDVFDVVSAEEGGELVIDRGQDADTLMVYLDDGLTMVKRADRAKGLDVRFGTDDRVFLLHRADAKVCEFVEQALSRQR